ncbi:MAG: 5'-3' exonuclease H3TH domain-containing protein, partial [Limisphaerales bacterium]
MARRLFLLDGMALVYRAHFAFAHRPIRTSSGFNTSALFGFTSTLLDILQAGEPTHLAVALDTAAPTARHIAYPEYKAQREAMPEELSAALPHLSRWLEALNIPVLARDGYEADDIIGTLVKRAEPEGFDSFMVTSDKDFGQLVSDRTFLWKPGKQGADSEILKPADVCARWNIARVEQVIDMLGLMGDAADNIPGVPGVGEKTAAKLLGQFETLEGVLASAAQVKGKLGEALRAHAEIARLSRQLATIDTQVPIDVSLDDLALRPRNDEAVQQLCVEFEFNSLGRRLFGGAFKAGRGFQPASGSPPPTPSSPSKKPVAADPGQGDLFATTTSDSKAGSSPKGGPAPEPDSRTVSNSAPTPTQASAPDRDADPDAGSDRKDPPEAAGPVLKRITDVPHRYEIVDTHEARRRLADELARGKAFCFDTETDGLDPRVARLLGIAFSKASGEGYYVPLSTRPNPATPPPELEPFQALFADSGLTKVGHNLKFDLAILRAHGFEVSGPFFDTMSAHALLEPELRHGMDYRSEALLGYTPVPFEALIGP